MRPRLRRSGTYAALAGAGLLIMAVFLWQEWKLAGTLQGVPLDDSWIHYRFAGNLRAGQGFSFNPGQPTPGSTAPLWVIFLSLSGGGFLVPSKVAGILAYLASGGLVYRLAREWGLPGSYSFLAGLGTLAAGRLAWAAPSGMETTAFTLLSLVAILLWGRAKAGMFSPWASLVLGLACLLRPEGYLLAGLSGTSFLLGAILDVKRGKGRRGRGGHELIDKSFSPGPLSPSPLSLKPLFPFFKDAFRHTLIVALIVSPYLLFCLVTTGRPLPNTFYVKSSTWSCEPGRNYFLWTGVVFWLDNPVLAILAVLGLGGAARSRIWKRKPGVSLAGAWLISLPLVYGFLAPCISAYYTRYTTPLVPVVMAFAALGGQELEGIVRRWADRGRPGKIAGRDGPAPAWPGRMVKGLMVEGLLLALVPTLLFWAPYYGQSVADIQDMQVHIGRWLAERTAPGEVLALNDIGAIGSIADREVIDLIGLASPEALPLVAGKGPGEWDKGLARLLAQRRPDYLVIFPNWFPGLAQQLPARPVYRVQLPQRTIAGLPGVTVAGGGEMVVYRLEWSEAR